MKHTHRVGIISDTHDNKASIRAAVDTFNAEGCGLVIHAGDFIAPFTVREFKRLEADFIGVFGNNDGERSGLEKQFGTIGAAIHTPPYEFEHAGVSFAVMHEPDYLERYLAGQSVDVVVYGHLHEIDIRPGNPVVINPGECCSWLTGLSTVVILDLETMDTRLVELGT